MSATGYEKKYDMIFVGTGMICVLEAVYQSLSGKKVLMIDRNKDMGGAWLTLEIFGLHEVENAIHYFLPDIYAFDFMKDVLAWDVIPSPRKFRVIDLPVLGYLKLPYDKVFGRLIRKIVNLSFKGDKGEGLLNLFRVIKEVFKEGRQPSYYIRGGTPEMLRKVKSILLASNVEIKYSTQIDGIHIDNDKQSVEVMVGEDKYYSETIYISHGSRISNLTGSSGQFPLVEKIHPRPAVHLLISDESPSKMYECIFTADPIIKYVHDVTRFAKEVEKLTSKKKLFVLALHKDVQNRDELFQLIFEKLKRVGMVGENSILEDHHWSDICLPTLDDDDLNNMKEKFGAQVDILKTEDFARGIGYNAKRWATKIRPPEKNG